MNTGRPIGSLGAFFLLLAAGIIDAVQAILTAALIGFLINPIISLFASVAFIIWLSYWDVSFLGGRRAATRMAVAAVGMIAEVAPALGSLPMWLITIGYIIFSHNKDHEGTV